MLESITLALITFLSHTWWLLLFFVLVPIFTNFWMAWRNEVFLHSTRMVLLEILVPREIKRSPRAMEQVLMALHGLRNSAGDIVEQWIDGEIPRPITLEIVSLGGEIHMYVRVYYKVKPLVESAFFSYYPDIELVEVPPEKDYVNRFPDTVGEMYAQGYNLYGLELVLKKEDAYPIKSYLDFESPDEDKQYDPMSTFVEVLGQVQKEQIVAIQFILVACEPNWHEEWKSLVSKLKESKTAVTSKSSARLSWEFPGGPLPSLTPKVTDKKDDTPFGTLMRTPGETDLLRAVEANLSQPAFETIIRMVYFSPQELYYDSFPRRGVIGAFNQYSAQDMNGFRGNMKTATQTKLVIKPYIVPNLRGDLRKQRLLYDIKNRMIIRPTLVGKLLFAHPLNWGFTTKSFKLTARSLATIFHPPTHMVLTAPHMPRLDSRKAGPPAGLAIFGEEDDIKRFE